MTSSENDEELLIWLRVEDTNLTDFAADRIEEMTKERDVLISQHAVMMMERDAAQFEIEQLAAAREDAKDAEIARLREAMRRCRVWVENAANGDHPFPELAADDLRILDAALKGENHDPL